MKTALFLSLLLNLVLLFWIFDSHQTDSDNLKALNKELKFHKSQADSLSNVAGKIQDSLDIAFVTIRNLNEQRERAHEQTETWRKKYNGVKFKPLANDKERDSVLRQLYPSIVKP